MFTGIIEEIGVVKSIERKSHSARLVVAAEKVIENSKPGDSISIDGACQTVTDLNRCLFSVDVQAESLKKTTLGSLAVGEHVNLERALRFDSRLGGHIVQGHVNATVVIRELRERRDNVYLTVEIIGDLLKYCVPEGSIALDGISLTIADIKQHAVTMNIIPATFEKTTLKFKKSGDHMNLETDIIGRYVENLLHGNNHEPMTAERLTALGY